MLDLFFRVAEMVKEAREVNVEGLTFTPQEARTIAKLVKEQEPKSKLEERVHQLAGRPLTTGQKMRSGVLGTATGIAAHLLGSAASPGKKKWMPGFKSTEKGILHPRHLLRSATMGALFGAALPTARRLWDIQAAKEGKY